MNSGKKIENIGEDWGLILIFATIGNTQLMNACLVFYVLYLIEYITRGKTQNKSGKALDRNPETFFEIIYDELRRRILQQTI